MKETANHTPELLEGRLTLTPKIRKNLNALAELASEELSGFLSGSLAKPTDRVKLSMLVLANYAKLHQSENGQQRLIINAVNCVVNNPDERRRYIAASMPELNLTNRSRVSGGLSPG